MMSLRVLWDKPIESHAGEELLAHSVSALTAFGFDTVYVGSTGDLKRYPRQIFRRDRASSIIEDDVVKLSDEPEFRPMRHHAHFVPPRLRSRDPFTASLDAAIPDSTLEVARPILRRLVHLTTPLIARLGPKSIHDKYSAFVYFDGAGCQWLRKNAPHVKLTSEATSGGWVLAHGEHLGSTTPHAHDGMRALGRVVNLSLEARPPADPKAAVGAQLPTPDSRPDVGPPGTPSPPVHAPYAMPADPDATSLPIPYFGPVLPFAGTTSPERLREMMPAPPAEDTSGDTVGMEAPFSVHGFSLVRYAGLRAALARHGEDHAPTLAQFGLDADSKRTLQHAFFGLFQARPELLPTFTQLVEVAKLRQG